MRTFHTFLCLLCPSWIEYHLTHKKQIEDLHALLTQVKEEEQVEKAKKMLNAKKLAPTFACWAGFARTQKQIRSESKEHVARQQRIAEITDMIGRRREDTRVANIETIQNEVEAKKSLSSCAGGNVGVVEMHRVISADLGDDILSTQQGCEEKT